MKNFSFVALISVLLLNLALPLWAYDIREDQLKLGKPGSSAAKTFKLGVGQFKYDTDGKLKFAHDGVSFKTVGSGSGGAGGINLFTDNNGNGDIEDGVATGWTQSQAGTVTNATTGTNLLYGLRSAVIQFTGAGQTWTSSTFTIPNELENRPCLAMFYYKTAEATNLPTAQVLDNSSAAVSLPLAVTTTSTTQPQPFYVPFFCGASGSQYKLQIKGTGNMAASMTTDDYHLGSDVRVASVSQAQLVGTVSVAGCAGAWQTASTTLADMTQTTCVYTPTGAASAPATMMPAIKFASLPAGEYTLVAESAFTGITTGSSLAAYGAFQFWDGTNTARELSIVQNQSSGAATNITGIAPGIHQTILYSTPQTNVTLSIRAKTVANSAAQIQAGPLVIKVYRFPLSTDNVMRIETANWKVDANIIGGNPSLGTATVASWTGVENSTLSLVNNAGTGNVAALIPCSSTNAPTGTTCAAGNESVGVSFNVPYPGDVRACVSFSHYSNGSAANSLAMPVFEIVETANNAQTVLQDGHTRIGGFHNKEAAANTDALFPYQVCGTLSFASAGQKTLRLFYQQSVSGTITASNVYADQVFASRDIHWEVYPLNQGFPRPYLYDPSTVEVSYNISTTPTIFAEAVLIFPNKEADNWNAYNTGTGIFTAPRSAYYTITTTWRSANLTLSGAQAVTVSIWKGSTEVALGSMLATGATQNFQPFATRRIYLAQGDTITIKAGSAVSTSTLNAFPAGSYLTISSGNN